MRLPFELNRPIAFFDLETTGLSLTRDRIVELAVIRVSPQGDVLERVRRFNPGIPIPAEAAAVHGITDEDVADEPSFCARARSLAALLEPCDLAGFNIRRFDLPVLLAEFRRCGVDFDIGSRRTIDMKVIFHREEPRDLSAAARFYLGRDHADAHSALGDIRTTAAVLRAQLEQYSHLPRDMEGLQAYCDEVAPFLTDLERWFEDTGSGLAFRRGKHQGRTLEDIALFEPDYLGWMLGLDDLDVTVQDVVRAALEAAHPAPQTDAPPPPDLTD